MVNIKNEQQLHSMMDGQAGIKLMQGYSVAFKQIGILLPYLKTVKSLRWQLHRAQSPAMTMVVQIMFRIHKITLRFSYLFVNSHK